MKNEFQKHKKSDKIKWILTGAAFVLIFVFLVGLCMQLFAKDDKYKPSEWFRKPETEQTQPEKDGAQNVAESGEIILKSPRTVLAKTTAVSVNSGLHNGQGHTSVPLEGYSCSGHCPFEITLTNNYGAEQVVSASSALVLCQGYSEVQALAAIRLPKNCFVGMSDYEFLGFDFEFYHYDSDYDTDDLGYSVSFCCEDNNYYYYDISAQVCDFNQVFVTYIYAKKTVPLPATPTKDGYHFVGWYYDEAFTRPYDNEPIYEDTVLYAKFEINNYTVSFNSDGGTPVANQTVKGNTAVTLETPIKEGYDFDGWYLPDGTKYTNQAITSDVTLTAHWNVKLFTVSFYVDGELYETKSVEYGAVLFNVVEIANKMNLQIMSLCSVDGTPLLDNSDNIAVSGDINVTAAKMEGTDKVVNTVKNNKWQIIGGVAGGVALIAVIAALCSGMKRKKR